ncbi:MAG: ABC transporter permease subunit [Chamaesiphon sp.]|nr:ABC transporter permease subunit [Chamaesiphon sp.]
MSDRVKAKRLDGSIPVWRSLRFWQSAGQVGAAVGIAIALGVLGDNLLFNLEQIGIRLGFDFLGSQAGFTISDTILPYTPADSYQIALLVGVVNSLRVIGLGLILATAIGITAGMARLSANWLVRTIAQIYVETLRNTPLLLQLFFWYFAVFLALPNAASPLQILGWTLSSRGVTGWGLQMSSEFASLLAGLSLYTGTFIAEIIRGGIQSVPRGQGEAARSLGIKPLPTLWLVVFPQALRAILPPLANQYLNLAKNSSLAVAIGYPDLYAISSTTFNQTGRAVEVMAIVMVAYLVMSLSISLLINIYNRSIQLVER